MKIWAFAVGSLILLVPYCTAFGEIYGWVDENGVKHYSNYPPPEGVKVFSQTTAIKTDPAQLQNQEQIDRRELKELKEQARQTEPPPEQAESVPAQEAAPDTVVVEDDEYDAFHRERIKRRTRVNTSPVPGTENRQRSETPQVQPVSPVQNSESARQNPVVERKRNLP